MAKKKIWPWVVGGIVGALGLGGLAYALMGDEAAGGDSGAGGSTDPTLSFEERTRALARETVDVQACNVVWKSAAARTRFLSQAAYWREAVDACLSSSLSAPDQCAAKIASMMVPGCPWPPAALEGINIDDALAGSLSLADSARWSIARGMATVDFYLSIRATVIPLL